MILIFTNFLLLVQGQSYALIECQTHLENKMLKIENNLKYIF